MAADLQKFLFKSKFLRKNANSRTIIVVLVALGYILVCIEGQECQEECQHGRCVENKCVCDSGWEGSSCQFCGGRVRLWSSNSSVITDGSGNYSEDNQCAWLIDATRPNATIRLHLDHFATECSWDHLYVFDGNSIYDPLLAVFSGMVVQDEYSVPYIPEIVAKSGFALLYFYSDAAYNLTGFSISYKVEGCASTVIGSECSKHGVCLDGICTCDAGWGGAACSIETCPSKCSGHGECHPEEHRCLCHDGYTGADCSQLKELGWWDVVGADVSSQIDEASPDSHLLERSSHTAVLLNHKIWVIGGHSFTKKPFLLQYDIQDDKWTSFKKSSIKEPTPRYGHSAVTYNGSIYIFGGMKEDGSISHELWRLEPSTREWLLVLPELGDTVGKDHSQSSYKASVDPSRGRRDNTEGLNTQHIHKNTTTKDYENQSSDLATEEDFNDEVSSISDNDGTCSSTLSGPCAPIAVVGHVCVVVQKGEKLIMLVIFGHSEKYGYLSTIQEYEFETKTWSTALSRGAVVNGVYGHTAVWDPSTSLVYIHGGLKSERSNNHVVPHLITYNPNTYIWSLRRPAPVPRFLHSSVLVGGFMLVFGGNTHNDTAYSYGAKCYSADFIAYDITCDRWHTLSDLPKLYLDVARYGHTATVYQDSMYIIGGFNGKMLGSVLKYTLGDCNSQSSKECLSSYPGRKCVWNRILKRCEAWSNNIDNSPYDECHTIIDKTNLTALCEQQSSCQSCVHNTYQCFWCGQECSHNKCSEYTKGVVSGERCDDGLLVRCKTLHRCPLCRAHAHCDWENDHCVAAPNRTSSVLENNNAGVSTSEENDSELVEEGHNLADFDLQGIKPSSGTQSNSSAHRACSLTCNERSSCSNCTESHCMWCFNQQRCVSNNSYLVSFPYGQCREWTTEKKKCLNIHKGMSRCSVHETCHECQEDVACGWCDDGSGTGIGRCMEGGQRGPINSHTGVMMASRCPSTLWFFTGCPLCNCNGHSHCLPGNGECITPCANNTEGPQCQHCMETFFGKSINGGLCEACSCNNHGETCNRETGRCNCHTKGVTGDHCERCDTQNNYRGEPLHGSCFYDLQIDYQFTFNLSKHEDRHIRQINFFNTPTKSDVDTDFDIACSKPAKIKISAKTTGSHERWIVRNYTGKRIKRRFSASEYRFGSQENNTTFHVYVYNFTPPIEIIVSFSQHPKLDLIQFFSIFSLCFLILLILAAILWKIKQKYDLYTRRQRLLVEMEAMASRPFRPILLELDTEKYQVDNNICTREGTNGTIISNKNSPDSLLPALYDSQSFRKRKKENPSPIALEPCCGNRAAVLSLLVQLPTGGDRYVPLGHPGGLAIASTLVTLGTPRKCSVDPITIKGDVNRNKTRSKQQYSNQSSDTCI